MANTKYRVGQVICIDGREFEITAIGRKHAMYKRVGSLSGLREDKFSLEHDKVVRDYGAPSVVYASKEEYDKARNNSAAWSSLRQLVAQRYSAPESFDGSNLEEIVRLLGLEKPK